MYKIYLHDMLIQTGIKREQAINELIMLLNQGCQLNDFTVICNGTIMNITITNIDLTQ